jgi:large subunit ribosomal protein L44e
MKFPKELNAYCPHCKKHQLHKAKHASKGKARSMATGTLSHERTLVGHGGKRAGVVTVKKQGKQQKLVLECTVCKKKKERLLRGRTKKKVEFKA